MVAIEGANFCCAQRVYVEEQKKEEEPVSTSKKAIKRRGSYREIDYSMHMKSRLYSGGGGRGGLISKRRDLARLTSCT